MTSQQNKYSTNNYDDGGDKNPPRGRLEKYRKLQVKIKRQGTQQKKENIVPKREVVIQDMDLDINIEDIEFPDDEQQL
jgi:hypothetical protein